MRVIVADEIEPIHLSLPSMQSRLAKSTPSLGPSRIAVEDYGRAQLALFEFGHGTMGAVDIADDVMALVVAQAAPRGSRWDGADLETGDVHVYGPGSMHIGSDGPGIAGSVLIVDLDSVRETIAVLGRSEQETRVEILTRDEASASVALIESVWGGEEDLWGLDRLDPLRAQHCILETVARAVSSATRPLRTRDGRRFNDRKIVVDALDFLEASGVWRVPMSELCAATGMSERSVERAFERTFELSPITYMRAQALSAARTRLLDSDPTDTTVSRVAMDHDFEHLGRFAYYYRTAFDEHPSVTLASKAG